MRAIVIASAAALAVIGCRPAEDEAATRNVVPGAPVTDPTGTLVPAAANPIEYVNLMGASEFFIIESSRLVLERGEDAEVRQLAQRILADHERSMQQLRNAAAQNEPPLAVGAQLSVDQENDLEALRDAGTGAGLDREYLVRQISAHERAIGLAQGFAETGEGDGMREHARQVLEPMTEHLTRARQLAERRRQHQ